MNIVDIQKPIILIKLTIGTIHPLPFKKNKVF